MSIEIELLYRWYNGARDQDDFNELYDKTEELLAQSHKKRLIEVYSELLKSLIENDCAGLKELKAFDLETYNKLKDIFGASDLLAQPEQEPLIDEEINDLDNEVFGYISKDMFRAVVRLIRKVEKAHGIGVE